MKHFLVFVFIICLNQISFSQEIKESGVPLYFGVSHGINVSNFTDSSLDYKTGIFANIFLNFKTSHFYRLQIEFGYSNQGASKIKAEYFTISPTNKLYLNNSGFHFILFPSFEFDLDNSRFADSQKNGINAFDLALGVGLGYELKSGLTFETRFKHGIISVDTPLFESENREEIRKFNIVFQFGISYKFKIKD